jgi:hypothetical protein
MTVVRRSFAAAILRQIEYSISPCIPPSPSQIFPYPPPPVETSFPLAPDDSKLCLLPSSCSIILSLPPHRERRRKKKRKRRRALHIQFSRPPVPKIRVVPLAITCCPDIHLNRSCGSINARDPPEYKRCDA